MKTGKIDLMHPLNALLGIFPSPEAYEEFKDDDAGISKEAIPEFIRYAVTNGLIDSEKEKDFLSLIEKNRLDTEGSDLPAGFTFEDLIKEVTQGSSVNTLIAELNIIARQFNMSNVQGSMFSRLKRDFHLNTPAKRNCIRIFSFWIGAKLPFLEWNYETILKIPRRKLHEGENEEKEGVRIAFRLEGRGEIIDKDVVEWLEDELSQCITDLKLYHINPGKITRFATTVFLSITKKEGPSGEPRLYEEAVRDSLAIAHQILNRFYLSDHSSLQKVMVIAIDAGNFMNLDASLQGLLEVNLPENPAIRVTSFVRLCSRLSDNRVIFSRMPKELKTVNGNVINVWHVECFWTFFYYDFIPRLMEPDMLPTTRKSHFHFKNALYFPYQGDTVELKALSAIHKFPENDLLILEIAKVCVARRMFHAANSVLSIILASNPYHIAARTFRMSIFLDLALIQIKYSLFELFYQRAIDEGDVIMEKCAVEDEEFLSEFGMVYYLVSLRMLSIIRKNNGQTVDRYKLTSQKVFEFLNRAEFLFRKGSVFSSPRIGRRCNFLQIHVRCLKKMLETDNSLWSSKSTFVDRYNIYETVGNEVITFLGWTDLPFLEQPQSTPTESNAVFQVNLYLKQILMLFQRYETSVLFRLAFPNTKFAYASMVFDFSPFITVRLIKMVLSWLEQAEIECEKLKKDNIGVYNILSCYGRIHTPESYINLTRKAILHIKEKVKDELSMDEDRLIDKKKFGGFKLIFFSFEEEITSDILVNEK